jgi:hypothetical protein
MVFQCLNEEEPQRGPGSSCLVAKRRLSFGQHYAVTEDLSAKSRFVKDFPEADLWPSSLTLRSTSGLLVTHEAMS